ncbi:H-2 class I histocompatibility antigen, alpha chain-like [Hoplias malabaricus]|uniref:H-2 class I histocompatibility antigen, alpha chain-like n=1 Tax=Hoplias malabaricus TaxID=27720 RepID=UPI0034631F2F
MSFVPTWRTTVPKSSRCRSADGSRLATSRTRKHTMFYLFTVQSEDSSHNIYQFSVETLLDDTQTDSYSSRDGIRTPKQSWVKEIKESEWRTGTEKLKYEEQWVNEVLQLQLEVFRHKAPERHVLQWRNGCEGEKLPDGSVSTLNCINEYGYDGEDLMSYNWTSRQWSVSVKEAQETVEKFKSGSDPDPALVCQDCVRWMKVYLQYSPQHTPSEYLETSVPDVYVFVKKSQTESSRLTLTCLATGFYPKDLKMRLRRFTTSLPDHLLTSSGVRPNGDGTYQLRKSVDVQEEDTAGYDCYVSHDSFNGSMFKPWDGRCSNCRNNLSPGVIGGVTVGVIEGVILLVLLGAVTFILLSKRGKTVTESMAAVILEEVASTVKLLSFFIGSAMAAFKLEGAVSPEKYPRAKSSSTARRNAGNTCQTNKTLPAPDTHCSLSALSLSLYQDTPLALPLLLRVFNLPLFMDVSLPTSSSTTGDVMEDQIQSEMNLRDLLQFLQTMDSGTVSFTE